MKRIVLSTAIFLALVSASVAAPVVPTWSLGSLWLLVEPYLVQAFGALVLALLTYLCALLKKKTGIAISTKAINDLDRAAVDAAGRIAAQQDRSFANIKVPVGSPLIAAEVPLVISALGKGLKTAGLTPDFVAKTIQAKVGQLQSKMPA